MLSKTSLQFFSDLKANNNRDWFLENKKTYENFKKEFQSLIGSLLNEMKPLDAKLEALEIKNCSFRINRDIRFSKDKSPYKSHFSIWMSTDKSNKNAPGYYIHYEKGKSFIAGGMYGPEPTELKKIRKEIEFFYDDLKQILNKKEFKTEFNELNEDENSKLKRAPKDFDPEHEAIEFLKLKSFVAISKLDDSDFLNKDFAEKICKKLILLKPLNEFLNRAIQTSS